MLSSLAVVWCLAAATSAFSQGTPAPATGPAASPAGSNLNPPAVAHAKMPVYHPPGVTGDVLPMRVGGGSRGGAANGVNVEVLVPDHIALTTQAQPSLYWFQSKPAQTLCEVTVIEPRKAKPLLVLKSKKPSQAGIHAIKLSDYHVKLTPHVVYKWNVAVVVDPQNRSQDIIANGVIEYNPPSPDLAAKLAAADGATRADLYAEAGIWYDALDSLSVLINQNPQDSVLQDQRAELLKQIGLDGATIEKTSFMK